MKRATHTLLTRASAGINTAIRDVELAQAQFEAAAGLEALPEAAVDMPKDFEFTLGALKRQRAEIEGLCAQKSGIL